MAEKQMSVYKIVLPSKKVAYLREMKISDQNLAAKAVGNKAKSQAEQNVMVLQEMVKLLLVQIDDTKLDHIAKNNLDNLLSVRDYRALLLAIHKIEGGDEDQGEDLEMELTSV